MDLKRTALLPSNSAIPLYPTAGKALREKSAGKNRGLALSLTAFVILIFSAAFVTATAYGYA